MEPAIVGVARHGGMARTVWAASGGAAARIGGRRFRQRSGGAFSGGLADSNDDQLVGR
jgi:hypothetical protein